MAFITIQTYTYPHELAIVRSLLESEGIVTMVLNDIIAQVNPTYNVGGGIKLQVRQEDYQKALDILHEKKFIQLPQAKAGVVENVTYRRAVTTPGSKAYYYNLAFALAVFTIVYNIAEGIIATVLGYQDESLALFGFGADSFIEVISGLGIAHMITRIRKNPHSDRDMFERNALRITGFSFYALVITLVVTSGINIYTGHKPVTTFWGVVISSISIGVMWLMIIGKTKAGKALKSEAILADTECTRVCIYMSVILLLSSAVYELTGFAYTDSIGTLGLAFLSFREGRECFEKAAGKHDCGC